MTLNVGTHKKAKSVVLILLLIASFSAYAADGLSTTCLGSADNSNKFIIYLHGMDTPNPSPQEVANRTVLADLASTQGLRVAIPRAVSPCPDQPSLICWGWRFDTVELSRVLPLILESRTACFPADKPFEIIGFSNGGYLLTHWYSQGLLPITNVRPNALIAAGSGLGRVVGGSNLRSNPPLTLLIGTKDQYNYDPKETFFYALRNAEAAVNLIEFAGGHALNREALLQALTEQ